MAKFVTVGYGLVTREATSVEAAPQLTVSEDPWINVSSLVLKPNVGDATADEGVTFTLNRTSLSTAKAEKLAELRDACADHIKNFGVTVGLGTTGTFVFGTKPNDQMNIMAAFQSVTISDDPANVQTMMSGVAPTSGTPSVYNATDWEWRDFVPDDVKQIADNLKNHVQEAREALLALVADVLAATTESAVNAIVFPQLG